VVVDPAGQVLDLGRTQRLFSAAQRLALWVRDRGCRFPGCGAPWAQAHHVEPWQTGGRTDLANGLLLCGRDHRGVHEGPWRITVDDPLLGTHGPVTFWGPDGRGRTSRPPAPTWSLDPGG
ncbi:MAG: HNH endonuclease, partial [Actinomycetia bacterium]|nr:HNH endonuclease [Actinomycetes bacterium]